MAKAKKNNLLKSPLVLPESFLKKNLSKTNLNKFSGQLIIFGQESDSNQKSLAELLAKTTFDWKIQSESFLSKESFYIETSNGPIWILYRRRPAGPFSHQGSLEESEYTWFRNQGAWIISQFKNSNVSQVMIQLRGTSEDMERGLFVGLELAAYNYKQTTEGKSFNGLPQLSLVKDDPKWSLGSLESAVNESLGINFSRHLVNVPPNFLNPVSLAEFAKKVFSKKKNVQIEVWDEKRLAKENMGLHLGVGQGAEFPPRMIRIRYRNKISSKSRGVKYSSLQPMAFVGKGVTFDTGGLDIKPSSAMRLMKKDMGGAAAVLGLALFASESQVAGAFDFYVGLAENSVDAKSMRPSDVLTARNGLKVEIHNTDAEGRLVLADVLDVAASEKGIHSPEVIINVATLTGAIKTALGTEIAGLFSNHDPLAEEISQASQQSGDLVWRMPLYSKYTQNFSSQFADIVNAVDGWGGPITAALFLEKFVQKKPWAHLDIYAWADRAEGALSASGGNGQSVQCLIQLIKMKHQDKNEAN